jgi:hypothetical protein
MPEFIEVPEALKLPGGDTLIAFIGLTPDGGYRSGLDLDLVPASRPHRLALLAAIRDLADNIDAATKAWERLSG